MYAAVENDEIIAVHDDKSIIQTFIKQMENDGLYIVKIKKTKHKKLLKEFAYDDLYLVRLGSQYLPYRLYHTANNLLQEKLSDFQYVKDILYRIIEEEDISSKDEKSIERVIRIMERLIDTQKCDLDLGTLNKIQQFEDEWHSKVNN